MANGHDSIEKKLRLAWQQERRFYHVRGFCRFMVWLVAMVVLDFLIDWGLIFRSSFPEQIRVLLLIVNIGVLGYVIYAEWWRHLKPYDPLRAALEVEAKHPELQSVLVSYTQLAGPLADQPNVSAGLIDAMRSQAVKQTAPMNFREVIDFSQLKRLFYVAAVVMVFFGAISINWNEHFQALLTRMAGGDANYPTQTQLAGISEDVTIRSGDSLELVASVEGVIPGEGEMYIRPVGGGDWQEVPMLQIQGTQYVRRFEAVTENFEYRVEIGDARSAVYRVTAIPAPQVVSSALKMVFPEYMDRKVSTSEGELDPEVPEGTELIWTVRCDIPVRSLVILKYEPPKVEKGKAAPKKIVPTKINATIDETGKIATFSTSKANESFKYAFKWVEKENSFEYDDVQHSVRVLADKAPNVELLRPSEGGIATVNKKVAIVADATDDHGLGGAWIVYTINGRNEKRIPLKIGRQIQHQWVLNKIPGVELEPGMQISYALEVADKSKPKLSRRSSSASRRITIVSDEQYTQWAQQFIALQRDEIKRSRDDEQISAGRIKQIKEQKTGATP